MLKAFKKWVEELQELRMAEACVQVIEGHYAEVKDQNTREPGQGPQTSLAL